MIIMIIFCYKLGNEPFGEAQMKTQTRVISFMNHKGGVGKTCSACNVGAYLATKGKKTLIIDFDPQANLSSCFGVNDPDYTVYDVLFEGMDPFKAIVGINETLDVLPSSLMLCSAELKLSMEPGRDYILKEMVEKIGSEYEFIVIDCPPALGLFTTNALACSTEVYIPLEPNHHAVRGVKNIFMLINTIKSRVNSDLQLGGVFATRYDSRKILDRDLVARMEELFADDMLKSRIRNNVSLSEAVGKHQDIFRYKPNSKGAEDYRLLTEEILTRVPAPV